MRENESASTGPPRVDRTRRASDQTAPPPRDAEGEIPAADSLPTETSKNINHPDPYENDRLPDAADSVVQPATETPDATTEEQHPSIEAPERRTEPPAHENDAAQEGGESPSPVASPTHGEALQPNDNSVTSRRQFANGGHGCQGRGRGRPRANGPTKEPLRKHWGLFVVPLLEEYPDGDLKPFSIVDELEERYREDYQGVNRRSLLRTIERHWNRHYGKEGTGRCTPGTETRKREPKRRPLRVLPQEHPPGLEGAVDFTHCQDLQVTIQGEPFDHMLFDFRLSHSGWTYSEVVLGETIAALMQGLNNAFRKLGGVPEVLLKDRHGSAIYDGKLVEPFKAFVAHYGLTPRLINKGRPRENGGVEWVNGWIKTILEQKLLCRKNRDFASRKDYEKFVRAAVNRINRQQHVRDGLGNERPSLRPLPPGRVPTYTDIQKKADPRGFIKLYGCSYSLPCRALGKRVRVRMYPDRIRFHYWDKRNQRWIHLHEWERLHHKGVKVDYRHFFPDILVMPGGFGRLIPEIKEQMFPCDSFNRVHEKLHEWNSEDLLSGPGIADLQYLRILNLAATANREVVVDQALQRLLARGERFGYEEVKQAIPPCPQDEVRVAQQGPLGMNLPR